jgi:hypothetical protein
MLRLRQMGVRRAIPLPCVGGRRNGRDRVVCAVIRIQPRCRMPALRKTRMPKPYGSLARRRLGSRRRRQRRADADTWLMRTPLRMRISCGCGSLADADLLGCGSLADADLSRMQAFPPPSASANGPMQTSPPMLSAGLLMRIVPMMWITPRMKATPAAVRARACGAVAGARAAGGGGPCAGREAAASRRRRRPCPRARRTSRTRSG